MDRRGQRRRRKARLPKQIGGKRIQHRQHGGVFAATPPLEALMFLLSVAATKSQEGEWQAVVSFLDVPT